MSQALIPSTSSASYPSPTITPLNLYDQGLELCSSMSGKRQTRAVREVLDHLALICGQAKADYQQLERLRAFRRSVGAILGKGA